LAVALSTAGCRDGLALAGSRHMRLGGSSLVSEYRVDRRTDTKIALVHVLFIPERDVPKGGGYSVGTPSGGTPDRCELDFHYAEVESGFAVSSQPVTILKADTVEANGRKFQLSKGNLFIAMVHPNGSVDLTQLNRVIQDAEATAQSVLDVMKTMARGNARLQALKAQ
jgi:hypothetical protein